MLHVIIFLFLQLICFGFQLISAEVEKINDKENDDGDDNDDKKKKDEAEDDEVDALDAFMQDLNKDKFVEASNVRI